jgi:hypothetical protein
MKSKNHCRIGLFLLMILFFNLSVNSQNKNQSKEKKQIVLFDGSSTDAWKDIKSDNFPENMHLLN